MLAFISGFGLHEVLIVLGVALLLFGAKRLPQLGRSMGRTFVEFKKGLSGVDDTTGQP